MTDRLNGSDIFRPIMGGMRAFYGHSDMQDKGRFDELCGKCNESGA